MAFIKITKGLDIPITGKPSGKVQELYASGTASPAKPSEISLNLKPFEEIKFKLLAHPGDNVKIGQPLAEDKSSPGRMFCSPAGGVIKEVRRGLRRVLQNIVISTAQNEEYYEFPKISANASREQIIEVLKNGGIFSRIHSRPFNLLADPSKMPRSIFVKALESAPFVPSAELQIEGYEHEFQIGLDALSKLTNGKVHLVYHVDTNNRAILEAKNVEKHPAEGPHPVSNFSIHIQMIDPIKSPDDLIWTLNANDVIAIGHLLDKGRYLTSRVISIAGPGILPDRIGYFKGREGLPVSLLSSGRLTQGPMRLISGDPLMGNKVEPEDFLWFDSFAFCAIPENTQREFLHFFKLGSSKYTFSRAYLSGHLNPTHHDYYFNTNQHGERRPFVDSTLYDKVMPLPISTMLLVKAVMAEDLDLAVELGLLSVDSEDFALPTFVCPSKIEMIDIVKNGLKQYAKDMVG